MKNSFLLKWLCFVILITSISACADSKPMSTPTETAIPTSTPTPRPTVIPPTPTATPAMTTWANQTCWNLKPLAEAKTEILGSLLYFDAGKKQNVLFDLSNYKTEILKTKTFGNISPDGSMMAIIDYKKNILRLDFQNHYKTYPIPDNVYFGGFLSGDQVWLGKSRASLENYVYGVGTTDQYYILSLLTGDVISNTVKLPKFWTNDHPTTRIESYVRYSPDLNYVFYSADTPDGRNVLLDLKTSKIVWSGASQLGFPHSLFPVWSSDSKNVIIEQFGDAPNYWRNIFWVSVDGSYSQMTHLEEVFSGSYYLINLSLSPNGRYLAFIVGQNAKSSLFFLDLQTNTIFNTCISEDGNESMRTWFPLFWSSDSGQLALTSGGKAHWSSNDESAKLIHDSWPDLLVLDLPSQTIYKLPAKASDLLGWLSWEIP